MRRAGFSRQAIEEDWQYTTKIEGHPAFYGIVIAFTFAFAYIYRLQLEKRPELGYGVLLLFVMGLGLRAWSNVG